MYRSIVKYNILRKVNRLIDEIDEDLNTGLNLFIQKKEGNNKDLS